MKIRFDFKKFLPFVYVAAFLAVGAISLVFYMVNFPGHKKNFYFQSLDDNENYIEFRYIKGNAVQGDTQFIIDELLLGPGTNRFARLFASGTHVEFCGEQDGVLYVGLSRDALEVQLEDESRNRCSIQEGVALLKKNVLKNIKNINTVEVFIDGVHIKFDETSGQTGVSA